MSVGKKDCLGDRMKAYEDCYRLYLTKRLPVIIRIDGRAFHTFTRGFARPFDSIFMSCMQETAKYLCKNITGCKLAYVQSDEISLLLTDYDTLNTQPWFDNNLQKLVSISASMTTLAFNREFEAIARDLSEYYAYHKIEMTNRWGERTPSHFAAYGKALSAGAMFDARAFVLPKEEVCNYFIWRQQDASRNSIQMLGRAHFSDKQLYKKNCNDIQDMLINEKGINWNSLDIDCRRGACVVKEEADGGPQWIIDRSIPIFTQNRNYIDYKVFLEDWNEDEESKENTCEEN